MPDANQLTKEPVLVVVMGVCGTGKSTLGKALSDTYGFEFVEGDELHPKANIDKMSRGEPLNDQDREPWLELLRTTAKRLAEEQISKNKSDGFPPGVVVSCSALRAYYRDILRGTRKPATESNAIPKEHEPPHPTDLPTYFVFMKGTRETLKERMEQRQGHYMKTKMLDSQLETLESPEGEAGVITVDIEEPVEKELKDAREALEKFWSRK